jgi:hypothetical protein
MNGVCTMSGSSGHYILITASTLNKKHLKECDPESRETSWGASRTEIDQEWFAAEDDCACAADDLIADEEDGETVHP